MSTRTLFIILSFGTLSGCGGSLEYKTDYQLCKALAEFPSYNIHQKARKEEVNRRGVSCSKYANDSAQSSVVSSGVGRVLLVAGAGFEPATFRL